MFIFKLFFFVVFGLFKVLFIVTLGCLVLLGADTAMTEFKEQMGNLTVVQVGERVATEAQTKLKQLQGNISQGNFDSMDSLYNKASQAYRGAVDQRSRGYSVKRSNYRF